LCCKTLAVADVRVALAVACRRHGAITLQHTHQLLDALPAETRVARNPWSWRVEVQHTGALTEIGVLPDAVFALAFPDGRRRAFYVECDRGTMPVKRSALDQTSLLRKFLAYEASRKQGLHASRFGWKAFGTLVVTTSRERAATMRALIERTPTLKGFPLFLFADHAALFQTNILDHSWVDATGMSHALI
jgi:hypothetical protein